jgi:hypothetical protein
MAGCTRILPTGLRETYPATAKLFDDMGAEESGHRASLIATYRERFGEHIPLIRRQDVKGFVQRRPFWLTRPLKISEVRKQAEIMELETRQFYQKAVGPRNAAPGHSRGYGCNRRFYTPVNDCNGDVSTTIDG